MSSFHEEIAGRLERHLKERRLVVFYDPRREFEPFVNALTSKADGDIVPIGASQAWLHRYAGSYVALRHEVDRRLGAGAARHGLVYVPGEERDRRLSPLMEFDLAGHTYEPQLRKLARDILRDRFSDGQIDSFLTPAGVGYAEIASWFDHGSEDTSILRLLYGNVGSEAILVQWILDAGRDEELVKKGATAELRSLVQTRVGLVLSDSASMLNARRDLSRYVLINELRMDLGGASPDALGLISSATTADQRERIRTIALELRRSAPDAYGVLADKIEADLGLAVLQLDAGQLGAIDTFRFEERRLLEEAARLLAAGDRDAALKLALGREDSHWVRTNPRRLAQWSALQQAAVLDQRLLACGHEFGEFKGKPPVAWIERYANADGWNNVDGLDRRLGAFLSAMDEEPVATAAIRKVRQAYAEWVRILSEGFTPSLVRSQWDTGWELDQTQVFDTRVKPTQQPVAFFVVDALRYEMAKELAERLGQVGLVKLEPAVAALPTITPVGMAALLPGASESFSVLPVPSGGISGAIEGITLADWPARWKHLQARVPGAVEIRLEQLLHMSPDALSRYVKGSRLVLVRSQDIDAVGEADVGLVAQQAMATVIPNLARAVHRLSHSGITRFVVSADHGHLLDEAQDDDMKIETPGGVKVDLHRRCWAGRGGRTPAGAVRVSGANLGYDTDLDFVFPTGRGVFLAGGGLRYHHGGLSLQELVIPVLSIDIESGREPEGSEAKVKLHDVPERITNRTIGVRVELAQDFFAAPRWVRVVLLNQSEQVGEAGMAQNAILDPVTKRIQLIPGQPATVGLMLSRDDCTTVKLVVLDAENEAVLAQSSSLTVKLNI